MRHPDFAGIETAKDSMEAGRLDAAMRSFTIDEVGNATPVHRPVHEPLRWSC